MDKKEMEGANLLVVEEYIGPPDLVIGQPDHLDAPVLVRIPLQAHVRPDLSPPQAQYQGHASRQ